MGGWRLRHLISILMGPEVFWVVVCLASSWLAGRNVAPAYLLNNVLSTLYWIGPSAAVIVSYTLCFQFKIPGPPTWWVLVRLALAAGIGVCFSTSALAEKIEAGSGRPGLAMGIMVAIGLHLLVIGCATVTGMVLLLRSGGGGQPLWTFVKQGAVVAGAIAGLALIISFVYDRQTTDGMSGEDKARRLSQAHGEKIGARFAGEWSDGRKNWTNFEIEFVAPNAVRLTSAVKYGEQRRDYLYVKDVVDANILALRADASDIYNCGSGKATTFNELVAILCGVLGKHRQVEYMDNPYTATYQNHTACDMTLAREKLGFTPEFTIEDGINDYFDSGRLV